MTNIKKVAAGIVLGTALASAPLVAFAVPAFADTGATTVVSEAPSHMNIPPWEYKKSAKVQHVLVNSASTGQSDASRVLVNAESAGSLRDGNAARCGGGINC